MQVEVVPSAPEAKGHVCWLIDDPDSYLTAAAGLLGGDGGRPRRLTLVFGPGDAAWTGLAKTTAAVAIDPARALPGGVLEPRAVTTMIRDCARQAGAGHDEMLLLADMDWVLPLRPTPAQITAHELSMDQLAAELGIAIMCAYRRSSFSPAHIDSALAVHAAHRGEGQRPQFRFTAAGSHAWQLSGEIDIRTRDTFQAAISAAASPGDCTIDVTGLRFIDVAGLRALARAASSGSAIRLLGASPTLRRLWQLTGFADAALTLWFDQATPDTPHAGVC
jgi:anti-anti-sigma factor